MREPNNLERMGLPEFQDKALTEMKQLDDSKVVKDLKQTEKNDKQLEVDSMDSRAGNHGSMQHHVKAPTELEDDSRDLRAGNHGCIQLHVKAPTEIDVDIVEKAKSLYAMKLKLIGRDLNTGTLIEVRRAQLQYKLSDEIAADMFKEQAKNLIQENISSALHCLKWLDNARNIPTQVTQEEMVTNRTKVIQEVNNVLAFNTLLTVLSKHPQGDAIACGLGRVSLGVEQGYYRRGGDIKLLYRWYVTEIISEGHLDPEKFTPFSDLGNIFGLGKHEADAIISDVKLQEYERILAKCYDSDLAVSDRKSEFLQNLYEGLDLDPHIASKLHEDIYKQRLRDETETEALRALQVRLCIPQEIVDAAHDEKCGQLFKKIAEVSKTKTEIKPSTLRRGLAAFVSCFEGVDVTEQKVSASQEQWRNKHQSNWSVKQILKYLTANGPQRLRARTCVLDLPLAVLPQILMSIRDEVTLSKLIKSSYLFSMSAFRPCYSCQLAEPSKFIGVILQPKYQRGLVVASPSHLDRQLFTTAGTYLSRFISVSSAERSFYRVLACGHGYIAIQRDIHLSNIDIWSPFMGLRIYTLPVAPQPHSLDSIICAAILPVPAVLPSPVLPLPRWTNGTFRLVILLKSNNNEIILKQFSGRTGTWDTTQVLLPFPLPASRSLKAAPVVMFPNLHLLDDKNGRVLTINVDENQTGFVPLPAVDRNFMQDQILSKSRGNICWIVLNRSDVHIFEFVDAAWVWRNVFEIPENYYDCKLLGHSEATGQIVLTCYGLTCMMNIEDGRFCHLLAPLRNKTKSSQPSRRCEEVPVLKDGKDACHSFDLPHSFVDHML